MYSWDNFHLEYGSKKYDQSFLCFQISQFLNIIIYPSPSSCLSSPSVSTILFNIITCLIFVIPPDQDCRQTSDLIALQLTNRPERRDCPVEVVSLSCRQECPEEGASFRAQQCTAFDSVPYQGHNYTWMPVYDQSECVNRVTLRRGYRAVFGWRSEDLCV